MAPKEPTPTNEAKTARPLLARITGTLQLQAEVYDEIAADTDATNQAAVVVALAAVTGSLGGPEPGTLADLPFELALAYFSWLVPGTLLWIVATRALDFQADLARVLRCLGFATTPHLLWLGGLLAGGSEPFFFALFTVIVILLLVANVLAVRQAFAVNTLRAVQAMLLGFLAYTGVAVVAGFVLAQFGISLEG